MRHCDDDNFGFVDGVDDAEWEAAKKRSSEAVRDCNSEMRPFANRVDRVLYVIEECIAKPRLRRLVEERSFGHLFLRRRKEPVADHRRRLRARAMASSPGTESISPRR